MRAANAVLLVAAMLGLVSMLTWDVIADASDTCRLDDAAICVESIGWLGTINVTGA